MGDTLIRVCSRKHKEKKKKQTKQPKKESTQKDEDMMGTSALGKRLRAYSEGTCLRGKCSP